MATSTAKASTPPTSIPSICSKLPAKACAACAPASAASLLVMLPIIPEVNYLVKMNSKTNLVKTAQDDPYSPQLHDLEAVLDMRANGVNVVGLGYTIDPGSEYESTMLAEAGQLIAEAHAAGLLVVLWIRSSRQGCRR